MEGFLGSRSFFWVVLIVVFVVSAVAHLYQLTDVPTGLYNDEASIGINAAAIAERGVDEHGTSYPVYFEAFGEYKNPIYIYTTAFFFKLFGVSTFWLRFTSFFYFFLFQIAITALVHRVFRRRMVTIAIAVAATALPLYFVISRVTFELLSHVPIVVLSLLLVHVVFEHTERPSTKKWLSWVAIVGAGLLMGASIYAYSTARLLAPLTVLLIIAVYLNKERFWKLTVFGVSALVAVIPFLVFYVTNPTALTSRLNLISYVSDTSLTLLEKVGLFLQYYFSYLLPPFLLVHGDNNLRHHSGYGGLISVGVFVLFIVGLLGVWLYRKHHDRFMLLMVGFLLLTPVSAALTAPYHALRVHLIGIPILFFAAYGFLILLQQWKTRHKMMLGALVVCLLAAEGGFYLADYFENYPEQSVAAFVSYGMPELLQDAIVTQPQRIVVDSSFDAPATYAYIEYYSYFLDNPSSVPIEVDSPVAMDGVCLLLEEGGVVSNPDALAGNVLDPPEGSSLRMQCY